MRSEIGRKILESIPKPKRRFWVLYWETAHNVSDNKSAELTYSFWHFLSGNKRWFCRIWVNHYYYDAFGSNKFEAYRKANDQI